MDNTQFTSSKPFIKKLDQLYLVVVSAPIIFFFIYYVWFLVQVKEHEITPSIYSHQQILTTFLIFVTGLIMVYIFKITKIKAMRKEHKDLNIKLNVLHSILKKVYVTELVMFVVSLVVFYLTDNQWMSLPAWLMFAALSFEKPSIYRVARHVKFPNKEALDVFINDEPFSNELNTEV